MGGSIVVLCIGWMVYWYGFGKFSLVRMLILSVFILVVFLLLVL